MQFLLRIVLAAALGNFFMPSLCAQGGEVMKMMAIGDVQSAKNSLEGLLSSGRKAEAEDVFFSSFEDQQMSDALVKVLTLVYQDDSFDITPLSWIYGDIYNHNRGGLDSVLSRVIMELCKTSPHSKGFSNAIIFAFASRAAILYNSAHLREPIQESLKMAIDGMGHDMVCPLIRQAVTQSGGMAFLLKKQLRIAPELDYCMSNM